tara:strand:+ start:1047 stop:1301 length:255 start_codon:yes stop_codon:yes gene_type:complete
MNLKVAVNTLVRIVAVFGYQSMAVIGGASLLDSSISPATAALLAGISAVAQVMQKLAAAFVDDGKLDVEEINAAFAGTTKKPAE